MLSKKRSSLLVSISIIIISVLFVQSCTKAPTPAFTIEPSTNPEAGDTIKFINASLDATFYTWDFGDGITSAEENPSNIYSAADNYTVTLTASNDKKSEMITEIITINEPTVLEMFALEDDTLTTVPLCEIWVYNSEDNFENNYYEPDYVTFTDADGYASLENMESQQYVVDLYKETETGYWGAAYLLEALSLNRYNLYNLPMQYYENTQKSAVRRNVEITKLKSARKAQK